MLKELLKIFRKPTDDQGADLPPLSFDEATEIAQHGDADKRAQVAERQDIRPELLYFLADDKEATVRRKIAANPNTPLQADRILAEDVDDKVRCALATKIARLVPGLSSGESEALRDLTFEILGVLGQDQLPRVREIVAEELKFATEAPIVLIRRLAIDLELIVSAPILEYSSLLSDEELLEIISANPVDGALSAIARREEVSELISDAIVAARDDPAVTDLLANPSSQILEETLDKIIERAPEVLPWHEPLVQRPKLSQDAIRRIATFVSSSLLTTLVERSDLNAETAKIVQENVQRRLKETDDDPDSAQQRRAENLFNRGQLDDSAVTGAAENGQREFVVSALSLAAKLPTETVRRVLDSHTGKAVAALCWKADFAALTAMAVQRHIADVSEQTLVVDGGGNTYPLAEAEMTWFLDYFENGDAEVVSL
ncbi:MAG: DUF2336 domain-containing protein [Proteobacteria bacterium]|nr:DUF2336 domain-containing protein [Pseudomonadota bacterium]